MRRAWFFTGHTTAAAAAAASRHRQQPLSRSLPAQVPFGLPTVWVYILIANVVLVNMLIAMFSETYQRIKKNAEVEYHYQRFLNIFEYNHVVNAVPPSSSPILTRMLPPCERIAAPSAMSISPTPPAPLPT